MSIVLTNSAKFNPYTFDEMLKPLAMAAEAYNTVQSGIEELGAKADLMKMYANEVPDSKTADMYNSYAKDLEKQASMLAKHGLTPTSRQGLLNMKRRYNSEIVPIETAVSKKEALTKEQRDALINDPSLMFDIDYSKTQLDYLLDNPNATYTPISGNELTKRAAQMARNFAKVIQNNPKYQSIPELKGQYFQQMIQSGYTPAQIMSTILNSENAPAELKQIANTVFEEAGLNKYSKDIQDRARGFINSGLYEAIGETKYDALNDKSYISPAEERRLAMEKERIDLAWNQYHLAEDEATTNRLGIKMPDGTRVKPLGGGQVLVTKKDGSWEVKKGSSGPSSTTVSKTIDNQAQVSDTPIIVANTRGKWRASEEGKDVKGTMFGLTRSNLVSPWGNYTLDNVNSKPVPVTDYSTIPHEAAAEIREAIKKNNLDLDKYTILQVPAESTRAVGSFDYVLMPTDQVNLEALQKNTQDEGL